MIVLFATLLHLPRYDGGLYQWCLANSGQDIEYCCPRAYGVVRGGVCVDPADITTPPTVTVTITQRPRP